MLKRNTRWILFVMLVMSLACSAQIMQPKETSRSLGKDTYGIDVQTILQSLDRGDTEVFTPQVATQEVISEIPPVQWSQKDYFQVAQALHEFVWQEPLDNWRLNRVFFRLSCEDAAFGPQFMALDMFKAAQFDEMDSRIERYLYIEPWLNQVKWSEVEYYPAQFHRLALDPAQIRILAEDALEIAEGNGGREARLRAEKACDISGSITPGVREGNWWVSYTGESWVTLFDIIIDAQTGDYEVIYPESK
jgi:hypothetical protein